MKNAFKSLSLAFIAMIAGTVAYAQVTSASLGGKITDAKGNVPGAAVIAVYQPTATTYYAVSDANGNFRINGAMPGGPYTIDVEMLGYRKVQHTNVYAPLGETVIVDVFLEDESLTLEAAVFVADGNDSNMNISRSGAGTSVSLRTMQALPSTSRSMNDVMKLTPQASSTSNGLAIGGGNYRSSYVTVDGAAFNNAFGIGSNLPAGGSPISLDALEQMSVNITPFDVRHSGFTGGAINAVTKSGTNEWKASVYDYYTSDKVRGYTIEGEELKSKSEFLDNTVGFTVGGPIIKNKLFFFVNAEYTSDVVPGPTRVVSSYTGGRVDPEFVPNQNVVRPTEVFMEEVLKTLNDKYGYNPGRYQGYSLSTPDYKLMARLDWNINSSNKLNLRFSHTHNATSSNPSNSVNPIVPNPYNRNTYGRTSTYAQYFESNRYTTDNNFTSVAAELNTRLFDGKGANMLRATWSHQNEPRSFVGGNFPTVDILENYGAEKAVLTSFGPDPFTYGNLRDVNTIVVTDELTYSFDKHNIVGGLQYEYDNTKNGYMQGGMGYYVYDSWESFLAEGKPVAFAITHSNRDDLAQVYPSFDYHQVSAYLQDEISFSDYFKLTAGIRAELPFYPTIEGNDNAEFKTLAATSKSMAGLSTADMPAARLNISPRIGFNWDVLKNRKVVVRGGSGLYTGRIPFVWIVSVAGNSNCLQAQYIDATGTNPNTPNFHANLSDILTELYGGKFQHKDDLYAPTGATILDKNLHMPTVWKSSMAVDFDLPGGVKASLEGIYNYDLNAVVAKRLGYVEDDGVQLPGEPAKRAHWTSEAIKNSVGGTVAPYYLTNVDNVHGSYYSVSATIKKDFNFGLSLMAAYTRAGSKSLQEGYGDQVSSLFSGGNYSVNGSNAPELGHSAFVSPNRVIANVSYKIKEGKNLATTLGLFYEGYNHCYVGGYSYTRYSYTMTSDVTNIGGSYNLIYIPTDADLANMTFKGNGEETAEANKAAFKSFIEQDSYLSTHRGQYAERGAKVAPWQNRINVKVAQDITLNVANKPTTLQLGCDINNVANLLNSNWGTCKQVSTENILKYSGGAYTFTAPTVKTYLSTFNTWQILLSARLFF